MLQTFVFILATAIVYDAPYRCQIEQMKTTMTIQGVGDDVFQIRYFQAPLRRASTLLKGHHQVNLEFEWHRIESQIDVFRSMSSLLCLYSLDKKCSSFLNHVNANFILIVLDTNGNKHHLLGY